MFAKRLRHCLLASSKIQGLSSHLLHKKYNTFVPRSKFNENEQRVLELLVNSNTTEQGLQELSELRRVAKQVLITEAIKEGEPSVAERLFLQIPTDLRDLITFGALLTNYSRNGKMGEAQALFDEMPEQFKNAKTYNMLIDGYARNEQYSSALSIFDEMPPTFRDHATYTSIISMLERVGDYTLAEEIFDSIPASMWTRSIYDVIFSVFFKVGKLDKAAAIFNQLPQNIKDSTPTSLTIVKEFIEFKRYQEAAAIYQSISPGSRTRYINNRMIYAYCKMKEVDEAEKVFASTTDADKDSVTYNTLIDGFAKVGRLDSAEKLFNEMPSTLRNHITYSTLLNGYIRNSNIEDALILFHKIPTQCKLGSIYNMMLEGLLKAYRDEEVISLYNSMPIDMKNNLSHDLMLRAYVNCHTVEEVMKKFEQLEKRQIITYEIVLQHLIDNGFTKRAEQFFSRIPNHLIEPRTVNMLLQLYCNQGNIRKIEQLLGDYRRLHSHHTHAIMMEYYAKQGAKQAVQYFYRVPSRHRSSLVCAELVKGLRDDVRQAEHLFTRYKSPDISLTNAMIELYWRNKLIEKAEKFYECLPTDLKDAVTYGNMIEGMMNNGLLEKAESFYEIIPAALKKSAKVQNALIAGYAKNGKPDQALQIQLPKKPNAETYLGILNALTQKGLVEEAETVFHTVMPKLRLKPTTEHWKYLLDCYNQQGLTEKAEALKKIAFTSES